MHNSIKVLSPFECNADAFRHLCTVRLFCGCSHQPTPMPHPHTPSHARPPRILSRSSNRRRASSGGSGSCSRCACAGGSLVSARLKRITQEYVGVFGFYVLSPSLEVGRGSGGGPLFHFLFPCIRHTHFILNATSSSIVPYLILLSVQILDVDDSKSLDFTEVLWLRPPPLLIPLRALLSMPTKACLVDQHARPIHFVMDRMQTHMRS